MCGRYASPGGNVYKNYGLKLPAGYESSYNVLPGSFQPIITKNSSFSIQLAKWGLIPSWSKEFKAKFSTFNARADHILQSPVFKHPFLTNRCLVLAQAFYEWHTLENGEKVRYVIKAKDRDYFSFAGLYDVWLDAEKKEFYSYTIVTTDPGSKVRKIHNREAVILQKKDEDIWLNKESESTTVIKLLKPYPDTLTEAYQAKINTIKYDMDSKDLLAPV